MRLVRGREDEACEGEGGVRLVRGRGSEIGEGRGSEIGEGRGSETGEWRGYKLGVGNEVRGKVSWEEE